MTRKMRKVIHAWPSTSAYTAVIVTIILLLQIAEWFR